MIEAASWAPSANHFQRYSFVVVTDRDQMARLAEIWQAVVHFYGKTFAERPRGLGRESYRRIADAVEYQSAHFADTPALIVACYDFGKYPRRGPKEDAPRAASIPAIRGLAGPSRYFAISAP